MKKLLRINKKQLIPYFGLFTLLLPIYIIAFHKPGSLLTTSISQLFKYSHSKYAVFGNVGLLIFANCMFIGIKNVIMDRILYDDIKLKAEKHYQLAFIPLYLLALITVDFEITKKKFTLCSLLRF